MAAYLGIQQIVRPLARKHFPEDLPEDMQVELDLPEEALLQDRYSVPCGKDEEGKVEFKYVPRHRLTKTDVVLICERDRKLARHYSRRADALESWFYRSLEPA
jgi:hypothetical protein